MGDFKDKITESTMISFHVVVIIICLCIWLIKLSEKVDSQSATISSYQDTLRRIDRIEYKLRIRPLDTE